MQNVFYLSAIKWSNNSPYYTKAPSFPKLSCWLLRVGPEPTRLLSVFPSDCVVLHTLVNNCMEEAHVVFSASVCATLGAFFTPVLRYHNSKCVVDQIHFYLAINLSCC